MCLLRSLPTCLFGSFLLAVTGLSFADDNDDDNNCLLSPGKCLFVSCCCCCNKPLLPVKLLVLFCCCCCCCPGNDCCCLFICSTVCAVSDLDLFMNCCCWGPFRDLSCINPWKEVPMGDGSFLVLVVLKSPLSRRLFDWLDNTEPALSLITPPPRIFVLFCIPTFSPSPVPFFSSFSFSRFCRSSAWKKIIQQYLQIPFYHWCQSQVFFSEKTELVVSMNWSLQKGACSNRIRYKQHPMIMPWLPPANEVWGKVIFLQACVKNSVQKAGGGGRWSQGVWRPPRDGYCCGRYASYWNAFLLSSALKSLMPFNERSPVF